MSGAGQPALDYLGGGIQRGGDVLADLAPAVPRQLGTISRGQAVTPLMGEEITVGHGAAVALGSAAQRSVPHQWRRGSKRLVTALTRLGAGRIDQQQQTFPLGLPGLQAPAQQRPCKHDAPVSILLTDADIDELRVEQHAAETLAQCLHRRLRIAWAGQGNGLDIDQRITGGAQ